jgi:hypothetical protein
MLVKTVERSTVPSRALLALSFALCAAAWSGNAGATLIDRGPDMVYDDVLEITWARNANLSGTVSTWAQANSWAESLILGGLGDWRLPLISVSGLGYPLTATSTSQQACVVGGFGSPEEIACRDNELGYMYWYNLHTSSAERTGDRVSYLGGQLLENIQSAYWTGPASALSPEWAWLVSFSAFGGSTAPAGWFNTQPQAFGFSVWAVRSGDVISVPEPATIPLLVLGSIALAFAAPRRTSA